MVQSWWRPTERPNKEGKGKATGPGFPASFWDYVGFKTVK